jgi:hypothetical protein
MGVAKLTDQNTIVPDSKYARVERERRYLLRDLPEGMSRADPHLQITDNYMTGSRLRLRKVREPRTNKWTVKFTQKFAPNPDDLSRAIITNTYLNALEAGAISRSTCFSAICLAWCSPKPASKPTKSSTASPHHPSRWSTSRTSRCLAVAGSAN